MKTKRILLLSMLFLAGAYLYSCTKENDETTSGGTTPFQLRMTDAGAVYDSVNIDIIGVEVKMSNGGSVMLTHVNPGIYNLLDYANGVDTVIAMDTIATATVSQVRLILGPNNSVVVDGVNYPLSTPSAQQSGLKLNVHAELLAGIPYAMLLDFDANKSIVLTGNGTYILKPVIRVITQAIAVGSIHGTVTPSLALPAVVLAINANNDTVTTFTNANGEFLFQAMAAGSYTIVVTGQPPFTSITIPATVVSVGILTELGMIIVP